MLNLNRNSNINPNSQNLGAQNIQAVSLKKGERVDLTKGNPSLDRIHVGLGWDVNQTVGQDFDLDASVFMLGANEKVIDANHFVFFNNLKSPCGSVLHMGDNLTGAGDGDDEEVKVQLSKVPQNVQKLVFTVSIYDASVRRQNFGQVRNAFIRVVDEMTGKEIIRFDLTEDFSSEQSMIVGEIYRHNGEWKFNATGAGYVEEINGLCSRFGII